MAATSRSPRTPFSRWARLMARAARSTSARSPRRPLAGTQPRHPQACRPSRRHASERSPRLEAGRSPQRACTRASWLLAQPRLRCPVGVRLDLERDLLVRRRRLRELGRQRQPGPHATDARLRPHRRLVGQPRPGLDLERRAGRLRALDPRLGDLDVALDPGAAGPLAPRDDDADALLALVLGALAQLVVLVAVLLVEGELVVVPHDARLAGRDALRAPGQFENPGVAEDPDALMDALQLEGDDVDVAERPRLETDLRREQEGGEQRVGRALLQERVEPDRGRVMALQRLNQLAAVQRLLQLRRHPLDQVEDGLLRLRLRLAFERRGQRLGHGSIARSGAPAESRSTVGSWSGSLASSTSGNGSG